jgi:hypothetical protein
MDPRTLNADTPDNAAWEALVELLAKRSSLEARVDALEHEQGQAHAAARAAAHAVEEAERAGAPDAKLDAALAKARARAAQPWAERVAGARRAVADADAAIQRYEVANLRGLNDGLAELGEHAARDINRAAADLVGAYERWQNISGRMSGLASAIRPTRPGDASFSRAERAAAEAARLLDMGGEVAPRHADPTKPRHHAPADDAVPA